MDIVINKVVIHSLVKEQGQAIKQSMIKDKLLDKTNEAVQKTVDGVTSVYGTKHNHAHYGIFAKSDDEGAFSYQFEQYRGVSPSDEDFLKLTYVAMNRMYDTASAAIASSGGYILFLDYANNTGRYFLVAMIKEKHGIVLKDDLTPEELLHLDFSRLSQAARISFGKLAAYHGADEADRADLSYLSFVSPSASKTASGYFIRALGCSPGVASAQATRNLISETLEFFQKEPFLRKKKEAFRQSLLEFLNDKEKAGESVKLSEIEVLVKNHIPVELSENADNLIEDLVARLNSEDCSIPAEFPVHKTSLNRFVRLTITSSDFEISIKRSSIDNDPNSDIYYDKARKTLTLKLSEKSYKEIEDEFADR